MASRPIVPAFIHHILCTVENAVQIHKMLSNPLNWKNRLWMCVMHRLKSPRRRMGGQTPKSINRQFRPRKRYSYSIFTISNSRAIASVELAPVTSSARVKHPIVWCTIFFFVVGIHRNENFVSGVVNGFSTLAVWCQTYLRNVSYLLRLGNLFEAAN